MTRRTVHTQNWPGLRWVPGSFAIQAEEKAAVAAWAPEDDAVMRPVDSGSSLQAHDADRPLATQTAAPPLIPPRRRHVASAMADDNWRPAASRSLDAMRAMQEQLQATRQMIDAVLADGHRRGIRRRIRSDAREDRERPRIMRTLLPLLPPR